MLNIKTLLVFSVITIALFLAAILYRPQDTTLSAIDTGALLPGLLDKINQVQKISVLHAGETVTLQYNAGKWAVAEKNNYPAQDSQVRELLMGLASSTRIEPKTRNPANYAALGLNDLDKSGSEGSRIELFDKSGQPLAKVVIGKRKPTGETGRNDFYALVKDDPQTWLAEGRVPAVGAAGSWLQRTLLELERNRIASITLTHSDGESLHLKPKEPEQTSMVLEGLKPEETLQSDYALDDIADRFTLMQMEDVQQIDKLKWPQKADLTLEVRAKNGLIIKVAAAKIDNQTWLKLVAEAPPELAKSSDAAKKDAKTPKSAQQEATELNTRWNGWVYTLADWAYQALNKRRTDLVKVPEPPKPPIEEAKPVEEVAKPVDASNSETAKPEITLDDVINAEPPATITEPK